MPPRLLPIVVHILAEDKGLGGPAFQVGADLVRLGVHPALDVADLVKGAAVEHALVVDQPAGVVLVEEVAHGQDVLAGVGLVAAAPDQDGGVVFVPLEHGAGAVHHAVPPFRQAARHVPGGFHRAHLLPGAVALQVGLVDHIDAVLVAQLVPEGLVGVVAGAHRVDVVAAEGLHGAVHILGADGAAGGGVPLVAVDAVEDDPLPVQLHHAVPQAQSGGSRSDRAPSPGRRRRRPAESK